GFCGGRLSLLRGFQQDVVEQACHYSVAFGIQVLVVPPEDLVTTDLGEQRAELYVRHVMALCPIADPAVGAPIVEARVFALDPQQPLAEFADHLWPGETRQHEAGMELPRLLPGDVEKLRGTLECRHPLRRQGVLVDAELWAL